MRWIVALLGWVLCGSAAFAHPPTEAAALLRVAPTGEVECVVVHDTIALLDDILPLAIDKPSRVASILDGVLSRDGVHRLAHRVLGEALGDRGMATGARLGADIAGGARGWLLERRHRR